MRVSIVLAAIAWAWTAATISGPSFAQSEPAAQPRPATPRRPPAPRPAEPKPAAQARPATPIPGLTSTGDAQPVLHARNAGMGPACVDAVGRAASATLDSPHAAVSTWFTGAADAHLFESIAVLTGPDQASVRGAAILAVGPTRAGDGCESSTVQVYPSARTCPAIREELLKGGQLLADFGGTPLLRTASGLQTILLPTGAAGCVIVAVGLIRGR